MSSVHNKIIVKNVDAAAYIAYFTEDPALWEFGKTRAEAIGKLVITFSKLLGLEFEDFKESER